MEPSTLKKNPKGTDILPEELKGKQNLVNLVNVKRGN